MGVCAPTMEEANASIDEFVALHGWPAEVADLYRVMGTVGDPDTFGEQIRAMIDAGIDGVTLNLCTVGHDPDMIALTGECADAAIG